AHGGRGAGAGAQDAPRAPDRTRAAVAAATRPHLRARTAAARALRAARGGRRLRDDRAPARAAPLLAVGPARPRGAWARRDGRGDRVARSLPVARTARGRRARADGPAAASGAPPGARRAGTRGAAARRDGER